MYKVLKPRTKKSSAVGLRKYEEYMAEKKRQEEVEKTQCGSCWLPLSEKPQDNVEMQTCRFHVKCFKCYTCRKPLFDDDEGALEYKKTAFCVHCGQQAFKEDLAVDVRKYSKNAATQKPAQKPRTLQKTASVFVMPESSHQTDSHRTHHHQQVLPSPSTVPLKSHGHTKKEIGHEAREAPATSNPSKKSASMASHPTLKKIATSAVLHSSSGPFTKSHNTSPLNSGTASGGRNFKVKKKISLLDMGEDEDTPIAPKPVPSTPETKAKREESGSVPSSPAFSSPSVSSPSLESPSVASPASGEKKVVTKKVIKTVTKLPPCSSCKGALQVDGETKYKCTSCGKSFNRKK